MEKLNNKLAYLETGLFARGVAAFMDSLGYVPADVATRMDDEGRKLVSARKVPKSVDAFEAGMRAMLDASAGHGNVKADAAEALAKAFDATVDRMVEIPQFKAETVPEGVRWYAGVMEEIGRRGVDPMDFYKTVGINRTTFSDAVRKAYHGKSKKETWGRNSRSWFGVDAGELIAKGGRVVSALGIVPAPTSDGLVDLKEKAHGMGGDAFAADSALGLEKALFRAGSVSGLMDLGSYRVPEGLDGMADRADADPVTAHLAFVGYHAICAASHGNDFGAMAIANGADPKRAKRHANLDGLKGGRLSTLRAMAKACGAEKPSALVEYALANVDAESIAASYRGVATADGVLPDVDGLVPTSARCGLGTVSAASSMARRLTKRGIASSPEAAVSVVTAISALAAAGMLPKEASCAPVGHDALSSLMERSTPKRMAVVAGDDGKAVVKFLAKGERRTKA